MRTGRIVSVPGRFYARRNSWYARLLVRTPAETLFDRMKGRALGRRAPAGRAPAGRAP